MGAGARLRLPTWAHQLLVGWFVRKYKVDLIECEGEIEDFESLAHFFVRPLRPGMRPLDATPGVIVSPVDGRVHTLGTVEGGMFEQAPGRACKVAELVGQELAPRFEGGSYAVLYLAPPDYHRVHSSTGGTIEALDYRPGRLWPVFPAATRKVESIFARNERLVFQMQTEAGRCALVMVGAFGVGRIANIVDGDRTNIGGKACRREVNPGRAVQRGEEIGRFELGSTVILLFEPGRVRWRLERGQQLRMGRAIGDLTGQ